MGFVVKRQKLILILSFVILMNDLNAAPTATNLMNKRYSFSPIVGYDPSVNVKMGAGLFLLRTDKDKNSLDARAVFSVVPFGASIKLGYSKYGIFENYAFFKNLDFNIKTELITFPLNYFDNSDQTAEYFISKYGYAYTVKDYMKMNGFTYLINPELRYNYTPNVSQAIGIGLKGRIEKQVSHRKNYHEILYDEDSRKLRLFDDENAFFINSWVQIDTRDNEYSPIHGNLLKLSLTCVVEKPALIMVEASESFYHRIFIDNLVYAVKISGGVSNIQSLYVFQYKLGGNDILRGYLENRFVDGNYTAIQNELRFPIYKVLSGVAFIDCGEVFDTYREIEEPKFSFGFGLRLGVPPSYLKKMRIDVGLSKDQYALIVTFDQAF